MSRKTPATIAFLLAASGLAVAVLAQQSEIRRTEALRQEAGVGQRDVIQVRVDFPAGTAFGRHSHPGVEIAYVLEGTLEYRVDGGPPITLVAGQALFIPDGAVHSARNVGTGNAAELATYIVDSGKPLVQPYK